MWGKEAGYLNPEKHDMPIVLIWAICNTADNVTTIYKSQTKPTRPTDSSQHLFNLAVCTHNHTPCMMLATVLDAHVLKLECLDLFGQPKYTFRPKAWLLALIKRKRKNIVPVNMTVVLPFLLYVYFKICQPGHVQHLIPFSMTIIFLNMWWVFISLCCMFVCIHGQQKRPRESRVRHRSIRATQTQEAAHQKTTQRLHALHEGNARQGGGGMHIEGERRHKSDPWS